MTLPQAIGSYSQTVRTSQLLFVSGQIATTPGDIADQTRQVLEKIKVLVEAAGLTLQHVVKTTVYLTDLNNFAIMNKVYGSSFNDPYPARATVQVAKLPKNSLIEIDCIASYDRS